MKNKAENNTFYDSIPESVRGMADEELLEEIRNDNQLIFKEIYNRYWSKLYFYAYNVLKESGICEDIVQDIFVNLWIRRKDVNISNLASYLYQAVKFQIYKHFRQSKYKDDMLDQLKIFQTELTADELAVYNDILSKVENVISQLPEKRRLIFKLSRFEELSNEEISKKLKISTQTVKNEISKSLKFVREYLKDLKSLIF